VAILVLVWGREVILRQMQGCSACLGRAVIPPWQRRRESRGLTRGQSIWGAGLFEAQLGERSGDQDSFGKLVEPRGGLDRANLLLDMRR